MSEELKPHSDFTNGDVLKWVVAQVEASREPAAPLPAWMIGAFEDAMKLEREDKAAGPATQEQDVTEDRGNIQDDIFKFELVYFKVEKTVFTVIKDWLMVEGSSFHDMFSLPAAGSTPALAEGATITNPIILKQTTATSFKAFLSLLDKSRGKPLQTYDEWLGALDLADRWNFAQMRKRAIAGLHLHWNTNR